jgi:hypothetical protein
MVGKGSARRGSVYQSGGIANSQGSVGPGSMRRGQVVFGKVRLGKARALLEQWWRLLRLTAGPGEAWRGVAGHGTARLFSHLTGDSET